MILGRSLQSNAQLYRDRPAVIDGSGATLSHAEFADRVWRLASGLARTGIGKNSRVAIMARNSSDYLVVHFALGAMGAWMVPINFSLKLPDVEFRLRHAEVDGIFVSGEFAALVPELSASTRQRVSGRVFALDGAPEGCVPIAELTAHGQPRAPDILLSPEDILYVGYTSGTTGTPKGALVSHRAIVVGFLYKALAYGLTDRDITINAGPYWHSAPRDFAALAVYLGGTAIVPEKFEPEQYLADVERYRATNSFLVPTMLQRLVASPSLPMRDVSSMRALISGGAPLPTAVKERVLAAFGPILTEFYGATETRIVTVISSQELSARERSVGRPLKDVELRVLDGEGNEVPTGQVGEVFLRGPGLFSGYWRDPQRTEASHRGEWFSLGDMGRLDAEGYLYLVDRKQDMIISGGENIFPNDIEECLERHEAVAEAAVIGVPDEQWGELVVAYVVPAQKAAVSASELVAFCGERLPGYMKPRRIEFCERLPRNPTGKLLRRELREQHNNTALAAE
jgi:acyl-CoA synthetase (AMP-forming)/AMP-acid ligase II